MDVDILVKIVDGLVIFNGEVWIEKIWMQGCLVYCFEFEFKIYMLYFVFVILLLEWSEEEEVVVMVKWLCGNEGKIIGSISKEVCCKEKRDMFEVKCKKK